ncbi:thioredoxin family protein [Candidatus Micrarchaeota archaeon]|nr:thioredoxin family protein [Candidatus Micrarchaeota archaeon]
MNRYFILLTLVLLISLTFSQVLEIYYFYGETCPHCSKVKPTLDILEQKYEGEIAIHRYEVYKNSDNQALFKEFLKTQNKTSSGVPALFVLDKFLVGSKQIPDSLEDIIIANIDSDKNTVVPSEENIIVNEIKESDDTIVEIWGVLQNPFVLLVMVLILIVISYFIYNKSKK